MASSSDSFELNNENSNDDVASPDAGARFSGILPETSAQHRGSGIGARNSLPWSRPTTFMPLTDVNLKRRSLGSTASVCNAATIQIPDISMMPSRMSMDSTCSEVPTAFAGAIEAEFTADESDTTVEGFAAVVWHLLKGVLQSVSEEYAQRLAILQSERPQHCSEGDDSLLDVATSAKVAPTISLPIQSRAGSFTGHASSPAQVASQGANEEVTSAEATERQEVSCKATAAAGSDANAAKVGSALSMAERNKKAWRRAGTAPAAGHDVTRSPRKKPELAGVADDGEEERADSDTHSDRGSLHHADTMHEQHHRPQSPHLDPHAPHALFHHGHLEVPKNFVSSACNSLRSTPRGSFNHSGTQEHFQDMSRAPSARGSFTTRGLRDFEALGGSHTPNPHRHVNQLTINDTINGNHCHSIAHDMSDSSRLPGHTLEADLDAMMSQNLAPWRPISQRGSFNLAAASKRGSFNMAASASTRGSFSGSPPTQRRSLEAALDAQMDSLVEKIRNSRNSNHSSPSPANQLSSAAHPPVAHPSAVASLEQGDESMMSSGDWRPSGAGRSTGEVCDVGAVGSRMASMTAGATDSTSPATRRSGSVHSGSSQSSTHHFFFEVLPVYEIRQKSLRMTRNRTSVNFGMESTTDSEEDEEDDTYCKNCCKAEYTLRPNSAIKIFWDFLGFLLIAYDFIMIPMQFFEPSDRGFLGTMAWIVRLYWTCDFPISLISAFEYSSGVLERRIGRVVLHYFKTWAIFDICILTLDYLENAVEGLSGLGAARAGKIGKSIRLLRMFRVLRMLRRNTLPEPLKQVTYRLQSEQYQIGFGIWRMIIFLLGLVHLIACCWYGVGSGNNSSWVHHYALDDEGLDWRYFTSFHWSLTQFAGSMDVQPMNIGDRLFAIFALIIGFLVSAVVVSSITSSMTRLQIVLAHESTQKSLLSNYLVDNGISSKLALRVQRNAIYAYQQDKKNIPESSIELLQLVSEPLRVEVHYEMYMPVLTAHPFFELYSEMSPQGMRNLCHAAVCRIQLALGDVVFTAGETPQTPWMYFLTLGMMQYFQESVNGGVNITKPTIVVEGQWSCEPVLWTPWIHHGTMRAKTEIILMGLRSGSFQDIVCRFQSREFAPKSYAEEYVARLNEVEPTELTDLSEPIEELREYCQKAMDKCNFRDAGKRSVVSGASGVESVVNGLDEPLSAKKAKLVQGASSSVLDNVMSAVRSKLGRSSTARSLSVYSNRSTTRSTTFNKLLSRTKSRLTQGPSPTSPTKGQAKAFAGFGLDGAEGDDDAQSSIPMSDIGSAEQAFNATFTATAEQSASSLSAEQAFEATFSHVSAAKGRSR